MTLAAVKPKPEYDPQNEGVFREEVRRNLKHTYDKRGNVIVPIGKKLGFTSAQGQVINFGYDVDGNFTVQQDAETPFSLASIDYVSSVEAGLEGSLATLETSLRAEFEAADATIAASVTTEATARASADTALASLITTLEADVDTADAALSASISSEATARASADSAAATRLDSLEATIDTPTTGLSARVTVAEGAIVTNETAIAGIETEITAARDGETDLSAKISSVEAAIVTGDSALATDISTLEAYVDTQDASLSSSISSEATARASADSSEASTRAAADATLTSSLATTNANVATNTSAIATETTARASEDTAIRARVGVSESSGGILPNSLFSGTIASGVPEGWTNWSGVTGSTGSQVARPGHTGAYIYRLVGTAGANVGLSFDTGSGNYAIAAATKYRIRAQALLNAGTWNGAGLYVNWTDNSGTTVGNSGAKSFANSADTAGVTSSSQTGLRTWEFEITAPTGAVRALFYFMSHWSSHSGGNTVLNTIDWYSVDFVADNGRMAAAEASIVTNATAIATETSARASADTLLTAQVKNAAALDVAYQWFFDNSNQGWAVTQGTLTAASGGSLYAVTGTASRVNSPSSLSIDGSRYTRVIVEFTRTADRTGGSWLGRLYYTTAGHGESGSYYVNAGPTNTDPVLNQRTTMTFDCENLNAGGTDWITNTITRIRLDFDTGTATGGTFKIHSVRIVGGQAGNYFNDYATTKASVATNTTAIATESTARASADTSLTAQVVSLRNRSLPDRPVVGADFTTSTTGSPDTVASFSSFTSVAVANEGDVAQMTSQQNLHSKGVLPVISGHTYRLTLRARVTVDGTSNILQMGVRMLDKDYASLGVATVITTENPHNVADGWKTFTGTVTAATILASQSTATFLRPRIFGGTNGTSSSGATWQLAYVRLEDITDVADITAHVEEIAEAYATDSSGTARLVWTVNVGDNTATLEQTAAAGYDDGTWNGSAIKLTADEIELDGDAIDLGDDTTFEDTQNSFYTESGGYRHRYGGPFGDSADLLQWFGSTSVALGDETKINGVFALATDGKVYYGADAVTAPITMSFSPSSVSYSAAGSGGHSDPIEVTPAGGDGSYTYQWYVTILTYSGTCTLKVTSGETTDTATVAGTFSSGGDILGRLYCIVTDSTGKQGINSIPVSYSSTS